jgi:hypothetical protein
VAGHTKDSFYEQLQQVSDQLPKSVLLEILVRTVSAKLGRAGMFTPIIANGSFNESINDNIYTLPHPKI